MRQRESAAEQTEDRTDDLEARNCEIIQLKANKENKIKKDKER